MLRIIHNIQGFPFEKEISVSLDFLIATRERSDLGAFYIVTGSGVSSQAAHDAAKYRLGTCPPFMQVKLK